MTTKSGERWRPDQDQADFPAPIVVNMATRPPDPQFISKTYGSVADLPSVKDLMELVRSTKLLWCLLPKKNRAELRMVETELRRSIARIDRFYALLGERN
jgi:hypothetical protein